MLDTTTPCPTRDLMEFLDLNDDIDQEEALERLISAIETRYFAEWDIVIRHEAGATLTPEEQSQIQTWKEFNVEFKQRICYIDGTPRPLQTWYEMTQKLAPLMLREPFYTKDAWEFWTAHEGWSTLQEVLSTYGYQLPLPIGVKHPLEVIPEDLRHRLNLQTCFSELGGLGYKPGMSLNNEAEHERIEWFIRQLKQHKASVNYFQLTLETLLSKMILPEDDTPIFIQLFTQQLNLPSNTVALNDFL